MIRNDKLTKSIPGANWDLSFDEWHRLLTVLQEATKLTWREVLNQGSPGSPRNHHHDVTALHHDVKPLFHGVAETAFRMRLDGAERIWGYTTGTTFWIMLFDRNHQVYQIEKRHT
ncbi:MAG: hypothetical protein FWD29_06885 [Micrococcales bacterium]|nr:hypothetical protein [Micrococcales bacterium]